MDLYKINMNKPIRSSRVVRQVIINSGLPVGWPVKWGHQWDINLSHIQGNNPHISDYVQKVKDYYNS